MKKKILIGSIFAALLMISMPFISALQTPVATSTSVKPSNSAATTNIQSINIEATITNINSIISLSANPETATPEQMKNIIQSSIKVLNDLGYRAEAASFNQQLQTILKSNLEPLSSSFLFFGPFRCALLLLTAGVLNFLGWLCSWLYLNADLIASIFGVVISDDALMLIGVAGGILVVLAAFFLFRFDNQCSGASGSTTGCSLCAGSTGSIAPMMSN